MSCRLEDVDERMIEKKSQKGRETHSDQSVSRGERPLPGCWTSLDNGGDKDAVLQADATVWRWNKKEDLNAANMEADGF